MSSARPSLSSSASLRFFAPSPSQSPSGLESTTCWSRGPETIGDNLFFVNFLAKVLASTRMRKRVGLRRRRRWVAKNSCSDAGTLMASIFFVPMSALANTARAPSRLNTTVFLLRPLDEVPAADGQGLADGHVKG